MHLIQIVILVYNIIYAQKQDQRKVSNIFEALGYSSTCVATALAFCEENTNLSPLVGVVQTINEIKNTLQQIQNVPSGPSNCADLQALGNTESGIQTIYPFTCCPNRPVRVFCEQTVDGGGWTVIQRRDNLTQRENFNRNWMEYKLGFGNLTGEFWLGTNNIDALTSATLMEMRIELEDFEGSKRWAKYGMFFSDYAQGYTFIQKYSGDAGDGFKNLREKTRFTAYSDRGGWWDTNQISNLNGYQYEGNYSRPGIIWEPWHGPRYPLRKTIMSVRPAFNRR